MGQEFDPYLQWLGISKKEPRPIHFYRMLGVDIFESDPDVIAMNGDKQIEHLRKFSAGPHGELAEKLINGLIKAKLTLLKPDRKAAYDQQLRAALQPVAQAAPPQGPPPRVAQNPAPAMSDPAQWNLGAITGATAAAPTKLPPPRRTNPATVTDGLSFAPLVDSPARTSASLTSATAKPGKSLVPWIILAASLAACVALTLVLANRHADDKPVAQQDPLPETLNPTLNPKTNPVVKPVNKISDPRPAVTPVESSTGPETNPPPEDPPAKQTPLPPITPEPSEPATPAKQNSTKAKASTPGSNSKSSNVEKKYKWPAVVNAELPQELTLEKSGNRSLRAFRYPGIEPRMATIVTRGYAASRWSVEGDQLLVHSSGSPHEFLMFGDQNWTDYTVEYEVYADTANMATPAGVLFRCVDDRQFQIFYHSDGTSDSSLQSWTLGPEPLKNLVNLQGKQISAKPDAASPSRRWVKYRLAVRGDRVIAQRDGINVFNEEVKMPSQGRAGLKFHAFADTTVRVRNIRVTAHEGNVLWEGIPELPPALARAEQYLWGNPWDVNNLENWVTYPKPGNPDGRWEISGKVLYAHGKDKPPALLTKEGDFENFYLDIKFLRLQGECDVCLRFPLTPEEDDKRGLRLNIANGTANPRDIDRPMHLQIAMANDGLQIRVNGVTKAQKLFGGGRQLSGRIGLDLTKPGADVRIEQIQVRRLPDTFKLFETRTGPLLDENPAVAANTPNGKRFPGPNNPGPNNPGPNPLNNNPGMPAAMNPDLMPRNTELGELAKKDEDVKKFLDDLNKARELCNTKVKKFEEDYLKAFDTEITRARTTTALNVNDRAELMQTLTEDKKDFETKKRFSLAHPMLPKNNIIGLILAERQKIERIYALMIDRMLKDKRDDVVLALKKAKEEDQDLRPIKVFSINYQHYTGSTPVLYEFMGDKTVNIEKRDNFNGNRIMVNNPQITWTIDGEKRLNFAGPLMYERMSVEQIHISLDGRRLLNGRSSTTSSIKTGTIVVD